MTDLLRPGADRAGEHVTSQALVDAMVRVESAYVGVALPAVLVDDLDPVEVEAGGNPVIPLVRLLRERSGDPSVHRGLTSQDVVDTALVLLARDAVAAVVDDLRLACGSLARLAQEHRDTVMVARTLTQHAVPTTFGLKAATWLAGLLDAWDDLALLRFPVQVGGAAGTSAALVEIGQDPGATRAAVASRLGLEPALPWHTRRRPITRIGDALVATTDACGRIARDVLVLSRPEIGELSEGSPGGSSTMPHKQNPVLATLIRSSALATPSLGSTLHLAAAEQVDERADGAWHLEWPTLRDLARLTLVTVSQTTDLVAGLRVHPARMSATLAGASDAVLAEQRSLGGDPSAAVTTYLGEAGSIVDLVVARTHERNHPR